MKCVVGGTLCCPFEICAKTSSSSLRVWQALYRASSGGPQCVAIAESVIPTNSVRKRKRIQRPLGAVVAADFEVLPELVEYGIDLFVDGCGLSDHEPDRTLKHVNASTAGVVPRMWFNVVD
jgi:hypothetical protein